MALEVTRNLTLRRGVKLLACPCHFWGILTVLSKSNAAPTFLLDPGNSGNFESVERKNHKIRLSFRDAAPRFVLFPCPFLRSYWNPSVNEEEFAVPLNITAMKLIQSGAISNALSDHKRIARRPRNAIIKCAFVKARKWWSQSSKVFSHILLQAT